MAKANAKQIACRTCGKMFIPCAYCEKNNDVFRWRNFACSVECAKKYIAKVEEARAKNKKPEVTPVIEEVKKPQKKDNSPKKDIEIAVVPEIVKPVPTVEEVNKEAIAKDVISAFKVEE